MIPELGHFALILSLCLAVTQAVVPLAGSFANIRSWMALSRSLAWGQHHHGDAEEHQLTPGQGTGQGHP